MKKFTFILTSMLFLLVGGVFSQSVTTLYLDGGNTSNLSFSDQVLTDSHVTGAIVTFYGNGFNGTYSAGLSGSNWVAEYHEGETHSFTINLNEGAPAGFHFYIAAKYYDNFNSGGVYKDVTITEGATSFTVDINSSDCPALLEASNGNDGKGTYQYVWIINKDGSSGAQLKIASITRTITTASSVDKPTITAPATYDGVSTAVTITPGANNHHVKYSVSGSSSDVLNVQITSETTIYITGSSNVTITAVGYNENESESNTNTKTITYSNVVPSGINTVWTGSTTFADGDAGWSTSVEISKSNFSTLEVGDYIFLKVSTPHGEIPNIGFRNNWTDDCKSYTDTKSGNVAYGNLPEGSDPYWWLKVTDSGLCNLFTNGQPRIQGQNFTLEEVQIRKHVDINEGANTISKSTDMIVNLGRSFTANYWNTVCLPFVPTSAQATQLFGEGYQLAAYTGVSGTTMQFTTIDIAAFEAGKPYLVLPKEGCATGTTVLFDVNITAKNPTPVTWGNYTFTGTFTTKTFSGDECNTSRFVATGNELLTPNEDTTLKSLRCYFTVPVATAARSLTFDVDEEGNTTGVADINRETITNNGDFFNLAGQRVAQPTKGLYIVNGKKVVIK